MNVQYRSYIAANTVIPAKAGIQYADGGMGVLLETLRLKRQVNAAAGLHFTDRVLDCRLRGNDGRRPHCPLFLRVSAQHQLWLY